MRPSPSEWMFSSHSFPETSFLIFACCVAACSFPIFLSFDLESLEMLDSQILELHLMAAINVIFSPVFLGKNPWWAQGCGWASQRNQKSFENSCTGTLNSVLKCTWFFSVFIWESLSTEVNHRQSHSKTGKKTQKTKQNRSKVSWLLL